MTVVVLIFVGLSIFFSSHVGVGTVYTRFYTDCIFDSVLHDAINFGSDTHKPIRSQPMWVKFGVVPRR